MSQIINQELIDNLVHYFRKKYAPEHAFADAIGMLQMFSGVVGIWPGSVTDGAGQMVDVSGNGNHLTNNNTATFNAAGDGLVPYVDFVASSSQYFSHADGAPFDILGTEAYIASPGLTAGCWAYRNDITVGTEFYMSKRGVVNSGYALRANSNGTITGIFGSGVAEKTVTSSNAITSDAWHFAAIRFVPSATVDVWLSDTKTPDSTTIAALDNNATSFFVGRQGASYLDGRISLAFLCAAAVPDHFIETFYDFTRPMFGG